MLQAVLKQAAVPVHQKVTIESAAAPGKPMQNEMIRLGDTLYMQARGQWMARPYDAAKAADDARQAMTKGEHSCTRVRSEAVDGQPAELYSVQSKTATGEQRFADLDLDRVRPAAAPDRHHAGARHGQAEARGALRLRQRARAGGRQP